MISEFLEEHRREVRSAVGIGITTVVLLGGVWGYQVLSARSGPAMVHEVQVVESAGITRVLVTSDIEAAVGDGWGGGEEWHEYTLTLLDPATGQVLAERRWPEDDDRPYCEAVSEAKIRCSSRKVPGLVLDFAELDIVDETPKEVSPQPVGSCGGVWTELGEGKIESEPVPGTERRRYKIKAGEQWCTAEHEFVEGEVVCDRATDEALDLDDDTTALLLDRGSTIHDNKAPSLFALNSDCTVRWKHSWPTGDLGKAFLDGNALFVSIVPVDAYETRSIVEALDPVSGDTIWAREF